MSVCTVWWLRRCLQYQARKSSRQPVRWPILSLPLPSGPGVTVSVDYFGPLPVTPRGNSYILIFTDRFSRRADMYDVSAAEFTAEGTANILVNKYIPLWGFPASLLSDNGLKFCSNMSLVVHKLLGMRKIATSAYHPNGNGGVERVTTPWLRCWRWSSTKDKTTGTSTCRTWNLLTAIPSAPPPGWPQMKCI